MSTFEVGQTVVINHPGKYFGECFVIGKISKTGWGTLAINKVDPDNSSSWVGWLFKDLEPFNPYPN